MLRFRVIRHPGPLQRPFRRATGPGVAKPDRGPHRVPPGVEEDLRASRTAGGDGRQRVEPAPRSQRLHGIGEAAPPAVGVLLGAAGRVLVEADRDGDRSLDDAVHGEQSGLEP